jgi:hypothetical protein
MSPNFFGPLLADEPLAVSLDEWSPAQPPAQFLADALHVELRATSLAEASLVELHATSLADAPPAETPAASRLTSLLTRFPTSLVLLESKQAFVSTVFLRTTVPMISRET